MSGSVLVLGSGGTFGGAAATAFEAAGWEVRRYRRDTDMAASARGVDLIVNAMNPPGYTNWDTEIPRITGQVLDAARASGATVLLPGNVYVFGDTGGVWSVDTPHEPCSRKGRIRAEMERRYLQAAAEGVRTIVLRAGDFISHAGRSSWITQAIGRQAGKGRLAYPGSPDIPHAWANVPDLARAAVALADIRESLPAFADVPFPGYTLTGKALAASLSAAAGRAFRLTAFPWWMMRLASPFVTFAREVMEMRYLWDVPHELDGSAFRHLVPDFRSTDPGVALAEALGLARAAGGCEGFRGALTAS